MVLAMGFEGSANKIGIGITRDDVILANPRHTCVANHRGVVLPQPPRWR